MSIHQTCSSLTCGDSIINQEIIISWKKCWMIVQAKQFPGIKVCCSIDGLQLWYCMWLPRCFRSFRRRDLTTTQVISTLPQPRLPKNGYQNLVLNMPFNCFVDISDTSRVITIQILQFEMTDWQVIQPQHYHNHYLRT